MASFIDSPTEGSMNEADVILNRTNIALARSQALIRSWMSQPKPGEVEDEDQDDEGFGGDSELGGIGSIAQHEDDGLADTLRRKKLSSNDKLLEQILGKKAAAAHKKSRAELQKREVNVNVPGLGMTTIARGKQKPQQKRATRQAESDSEEEGRAAAFKSKKAKPKQSQQVANNLEQAGIEDVKFTASADPESSIARHPPPALDYGNPQSGSRAQKRQAGSYLDEILAQKAKKKSKKKRHNTSAET